MALRITIDVFSGRPNPVVELDDAASRELAERIRPAGALKRTEAKPPPESILGYRGIIVEQTGEGRIEGLPGSLRIVDGKLFGAKLAQRPADGGIEEFICGPDGPIRLARLEDDVVKRIRELIEKRRSIDFRWPPITWPTLLRCRCAPLYEPAWWNDGGLKQANNNCYNYATNYRSDSFAQPGAATGQQYTDLTCASVRPAAVRDGLIASPRAANKCPGEGHLVALVIDLDNDFHWYRKGRNGLWTHKPGPGKVTNVDNSGHLITDPRTADRGGYETFCTFMTVMHGHVVLD